MESKPVLTCVQSRDLQEKSLAGARRPLPQLERAPNGVEQRMASRNADSVPSLVQFGVPNGEFPQQMLPFMRNLS